MFVSLICKKLFVVFTSLKVIFDRSDRGDICRERSYPESDISQLESCQRNQRRSDGAGRPYFLRTLEYFWNEILAQSKTKRTSFQGKCKKLCPTEDCTRSSQNFISLNTPHRPNRQSISHNFCKRYDYFW